MTSLRFLSCAFFLATSAAMGAVLSEGEVIFDGDSVIVGQETSGTLTVTPPDVLALDSLTIAQEARATGTVLIDGAGIIAENGLSIASEGVGTLTVQNGGQLTGRGLTTIGSDGLGRLEVLGAGSVANLVGDTFRVGGGATDGTSGLGRGEILVSQGAELITHGSTVGVGGTAEVIVEGNGSVWREQSIMRFGNANLTLRDGGRLIHTGFSRRDILQFGVNGGTSIVLVSGQDSLLSNDYEILIGESGQALVRVEEGADVVANTTHLGKRSSNAEGPRRGILELDGFGTTWTTDQLTLGNDEGHAEVRITDGAVLNVTGFSDAFLAFGDNSTAIVTIDGPHSRWNNSGFQVTGDLRMEDGSGRSELRITGGAYHENGYVSLENAASKILVSGVGSHWNVHDDLDLIQGEVIVSDGATMQMPRDFRIEEEGRLRLDGGELLGNPNNLLINNWGQISGDGTIESHISIFSTGSIYVDPGQQLQVDSLQNNGQVRIEGGELRVAGHLRNIGAIDLDNATLRADNINLEPFLPVANEIRFLGGENRIEANYTNLNGRAIVRGNSTVTFTGAVSNHGFFSITNGSTAYFLDQYFSSNDVYGDGHIVFEGGVQLESDTTFGTDITFAPTASWAVGILGSSDSLISDGTVNLGGELSIGFALPFPGSGLQELTIIEATQVEGTFDFLPEIDSLIGHRTFFRGIEYTDTTVTLLVELLAEDDFNGDGLVDAADYDAWADGFGSTTGNSLADGNGDGLVNAADYTLWRDAMDGELPATVPEPTGLAICLLLGLALQGRRFRL